MIPKLFSTLWEGSNCSQLLLHEDNLLGTAQVTFIGNKRLKALLYSTWTVTDYILLRLIWYKIWIYRLSVRLHNLYNHISNTWKVFYITFTEYNCDLLHPPFPKLGACTGIHTCNLVHLMLEALAIRPSDNTISFSWSTIQSYEEVLKMLCNHNNKDSTTDSRAPWKHPCVVSCWWKDWTEVTWGDSDVIEDVLSNEQVVILLGNSCYSKLANYKNVSVAGSSWNTEVLQVSPKCGWCERF